jgi:hypothetical protein
MPELTDFHPAFARAHWKTDMKHHREQRYLAWTEWATLVPKHVDPYFADYVIQWRVLPSGDVIRRVLFKEQGIYTPWDVRWVPRHIRRYRKAGHYHKFLASHLPALPMMA